MPPTSKDGNNIPRSLEKLPFGPQRSDHVLRPNPGHLSSAPVQKLLRQYFLRHVRVERTSADRRAGELQPYPSTDPGPYVLCRTSLTRRCTHRPPPTCRWILRL